MGINIQTNSNNYDMYLHIYLHPLQSVAKGAAELDLSNYILYTVSVKCISTTKCISTMNYKLYRLYRTIEGNYYNTL